MPLGTNTAALAALAVRAALDGLMAPPPAFAPFGAAPLLPVGARLGDAAGEGVTIGTARVLRCCAVVLC